jgi:outer membrane protein
MNECQVKSSIAAVFMAAAAVAQAQSESSSHEVQVGIAHAMPNTSSTTFAIVSPTPAEVPGSGFTTGNLTRLGLNYAYRFNDASWIELIAGLPRRATFTGTGSISGSPLNPLGSAVPIDPVVMYRYRFGTVGDRLRFNVGAGINYTYFAKPELTDQFRVWLSQQLSAGAISTFASDVKFQSSWNPAVSVGATYQLDRGWKLVANLLYVPLKSRATIRTSAGGTEVISSGELTVNPRLLFVGVAYSL